MESGSSADETYRSSWFAYKHMLCILQGDEAREGKDTVTTLEESLVSIPIWIFLSLSYIACTTDIYLATTRVLHST